MIKTIQKTALFLACLSAVGLAEAREIANYVQKNQTSSNVLAFNCTPSTSGIVMEINNVRTYMLGGGDFWWDLDNARYEVPAGSGKNSVFAGSIWIGGLTENGNLKAAAQTYRQGNEIDFWPGPLDGNETIFNPVSGEDEPNPNFGQTNIDICSDYDKHFKVSLEEVADFVANGTMTPAIANWPGNGVNGELNTILAPFYDQDQDGVYEPNQGDYPYYANADPDNPDVDCKDNNLLFGDETIFWVYNDRGNTHTATLTESIGLEFRSQAFAFRTNDEINDMTFYNYKIQNKTSNVLKNTFFGTWVDSDVGNYEDDFVGCDVNRGLGYTYNGDANDEGATGYGINPPALGMDFFQGPIADVADGIDNDKDGCIDCTYSYDENGEIDSIIPDDKLREEIIMSKFVYFNNDFDPISGNPEGGSDYYNLLTGKWKNGNPITYGGSGLTSSNPPCDYMFPDDTDPKFTEPWTEESAKNKPADRRFLISAGPFTLEPGGQYNITTGLVWARADQGGPFASVQKMILADDKAQALFDGCFEVLEGPQAPSLAFQEYDRTLVVTFENYQQAETFEEEDNNLVSTDAIPINDKFYRFEGYQVFQLKDETVSGSELYNPDKARLVFQTDIKNFKQVLNNDGTIEEKPIGRLINYVYNEDLEVFVPQDMTISAANQGIKHSFEITQDAFAEGDKRLVNNKVYHYMPVAYAFNEYTPYKQDQEQIEPIEINYIYHTNSSGDTTSTDTITTYNDVSLHPNLHGQKRTFLPSRDLTSYSASPYPNTETLYGAYGTRPAMTRVQGKGSSGFELKLTPASEADIVTNYCASDVEYQEDFGPVDIYVIDPEHVIAADYTFMLINSDNTEGVKETTGWILIQNPGTAEADTMYSDQAVSVNSEQLLPDWGLAVSVNTNMEAPFVSKEANNGYINSSITYEDASKEWLGFMPDRDSPEPYNWILAGQQSSKKDDDPSPTGTSSTHYDVLDVAYGNATNDAPLFMDPNGIYENIVSGTWAPIDFVSSVNGFPNVQLRSIEEPGKQLLDLPSIKVVFTPNKDLWTRALVINTDPSIADTENKITKLIRTDASVDKNGNPDGSGTKGWSWFPGYAIDKTSGKRLNISFGENASDPKNNGDNMMFDPTSTFGTFNLNQASLPVVEYTDYTIGGMHYIYVMSTQYQGDDEQDHPSYAHADRVINFSNVADKKIGMIDLFADMSWVSMPLLAIGQEVNAADVIVDIDVSQPLKGWENDQELIDCSGSDTNNRLPVYTFNTGSLESTSYLTDNNASNPVDLVSVVPNPYYGGSSYEQNQIDHRVRITNIPSNTIVTIYTVDGAFIQQIKVDSKGDYDWNLKNSKGISIASGMYLIHLKTPSAERVIKWVGTLRPIDLDSF
ncbi:MAG: hypothetical protein ACPGVE_05755 [Flavobacteriales bacterium]